MNFSWAAAEEGLDGLYVAPCYDLEIIFARGSGGERYNTVEFNALAEAAQKLTNDYYIITLTHDLDYPAVEMSSPARLLGAFVSAGKAYEYGASVDAGVASLREHYLAQSKDCPDMNFALVGYSQGAQVVANAASVFDVERLKFVMLIGDPNTYLPEGEGLFPEACNGGALSPWRTFAPNCRTYEGVFGGRKPYELKALEGKYSLWCNREDYICGSSKNPLKNDGHVQYADSVLSWGVAHLARKYLGPYTPSSEPPLRSMRKFEGDLTLDNSLVDDGAFGANIDAPSEVYVWRDGDVLRLRWDAPTAAKHLLLRFNGFDLGYIDADLGEFEIRDIDFSGAYSLSLAWMDSTGELGEFLTSESSSISDVAPMNNAGDGVIDMPSADASTQETPIVESNKPSVISNTYVRSFAETPMDAGLVLAPPSSAVKDVATDGVVAMPQAKNTHIGLSFSDKSSVVAIILSMFGAGGLLTIFIIRSRRGA